MGISQKNTSYGNGGIGAEQSQRRHMVTLAAILASIILLLGTVSLYAINNLEKAIDEQAETDMRLKKLLSHSIDADASFRTMIQEWKNLMLRGHLAPDKERYKTAYAMGAELAINNLTDMTVVSELDGPMLAQIAELKVGISGLLEKYNAAANQYELLTVDDIHNMDSAVRGADRTLHQDFKILNKQIYELSQRQEEILRVSIWKQVDITEKVIMWAVLACLLLAGVILVFAVRQVGFRGKVG